MDNVQTPNPEFEAKRDRMAAQHFYSIRAKYYDMFQPVGDFGDEQMIDEIFSKLQSRLKDGVGVEAIEKVIEPIEQEIWDYYGDRWKWHTKGIEKSSSYFRLKLATAISALLAGKKGWRWGYERASKSLF